jgi:hypothetical protein
VPAELVAQCGDHLHGRGVVLARAEAGEQRSGDDRQRDGVLDGRLDGPPALTGVLRVAAQGGQVVVLLEGVHHQVEQPGPDDRALLPAGDDGGDIGDDVGRHHQLPALRVGLHEAVLDAVVHHLGEVPGADLAGVHEAGVALGLEDVEERLHPRDVLVVAAAHQRVALGQAPDAAADAAVDEADALGGQLLAVPHVVGVAGVAAVDQHVTGSSSSARASTVSYVGCPAGTMTHTTRGAGSAETSASRLSTCGRCPRSGRSRPPRGRRGAAARPCCRPSCPAR